MAVQVIKIDTNRPGQVIIIGMDNNQEKRIPICPGLRVVNSQIWDAMMYIINWPDGEFIIDATHVIFFEVNYDR